MLNQAADGNNDGRVPVSDGAGRVDALGENVTTWQIGDCVAISFFEDWISGPFRSRYMASAHGGRTTDGVLADYVVVPSAALVEASRHISPEQTATLPCAAVTAWHGLVARGGLRAGDTLLIQGTGGVAVFGLQFAVALGARAIVLSSSDAKLAQARDMGASHLINYRITPDWDSAVRERTGSEGANHILELGGPQTYTRSLRCPRRGGPDRAGRRADRL